MKFCKRCLIVSLVAVLVGLGGCAQGVSQAEYDKVKGDLNTANTQIQSLEAQLNSANSQSNKLQADYETVKATYDKTKADSQAAQTQLNSLQNEYTSVTSDRDKAKTEAARLQGMLTQAAPYLHIMDLSLEQQRSEIGIKSKYWQYNQDYLQAEIAKAVAASKDATLKSLWDIFKQNPQNESRWFLYAIAAATSILSGEGVSVAVLPATPVVSPSPTGQPLLRVKILQIDGTPVPNLEVDLWTPNSPPGPPNAGVSRTNSLGIATFAVDAGDYRVGFNGSNFPATYVYSNGTWAKVQAAMVTDIEIRLFKKEG